MISLNVSIQNHYNISFSPNDVLIGYLPLAHVFERFVEANALSNGACIGYYQVRRRSLCRSVGIHEQSRGRPQAAPPDRLHLRPPPL